MAADYVGHENSARVGTALIVSLQNAKSQATKIYAALDAKGYGIIKRQQLAEALPDNKVCFQLAHWFNANALAASTDTPSLKAVHRSWNQRSADHQSLAPGH